jgi:hypothetical protein
LDEAPLPPSPDVDALVSPFDAEADAPPSPPEPPEPPESLLELLDEPSGEPLAALAAAAAAFVEDEPPRSFLAQPEPLKWIAGVENSLRIVPDAPHDGQNPGPGSLMPSRMSARWSQAVQMYS